MKSLEMRCDCDALGACYAFTAFKKAERIARQLFGANEAQKNVVRRYKNRIRRRS